MDGITDLVPKRNFFILTKEDLDKFLTEALEKGFCFEEGCNAEEFVPFVEFPFFIAVHEGKRMSCSYTFVYEETVIYRK